MNGFDWAWVGINAVLLTVWLTIAVIHAIA